MKVLHLINTLSAGGAELHLLTLCRHMKRQGVELIVACLKEHVRASRSLRPDFEEEKIRIIDLRASRRYDWRGISRLARLLRAEQPDILHTHLPRADIGAALINQWTRAPGFLCSVHGIYRDRSYGYWAPLMRHAYRKADAVVAISSAVEDWLVTDLGIARNKIKMIHYGIEPGRFTPSASDKDEKVPRLPKSAVDHSQESTFQDSPKQTGHLVGSIGRLEAGKGFDCLTHAMSMVCKLLPDASLLIGGADTWEYRKELELLIGRLALQEKVQLVGFQHNVAAFLQKLDVFAFASRSEGFGQVLIEAMAAGKPVVASKIPPLTEIVVDGKTGLLVNADDSRGFADAIVWLLTNREQAQEMGRHGQERVLSHFSAGKMTTRTLSLYNALLESRQYGPVHQS